MGQNVDWIRRRQRRAVAARQRQLRERRMRLARMQYALLIGLAAAVICSISFNALEIRPAFGVEAESSAAGCRASMSWPLDAGSSGPTVIKAFKSPPQPWLSGHRGVDLRVDADVSTTIRAPMDGIISFAGNVAGKKVVSVRHGTRTSTFEPAQTSLAVGAPVSRGNAVARVEGHSDHCDATCLHWGVKTADGSYLDPESLASPHRIVLKTVR